MQENTLNIPNMHVNNKSLTDINLLAKYKRGTGPEKNDENISLSSIYNSRVPHSLTNSEISKLQIKTNNIKNSVLQSLDSNIKKDSAIKLQSPAVLQVMTEPDMETDQSRSLNSNIIKKSLKPVYCLQVQKATTSQLQQQQQQQQSKQQQQFAFNNYKNENKNISPHTLQKRKDIVQNVIQRQNSMLESEIEMLRSQQQQLTNNILTYKRKFEHSQSIKDQNNQIQKQNQSQNQIQIQHQKQCNANLRFTIPKKQIQNSTLKQAQQQRSISAQMQNTSSSSQSQQTQQAKLQVENENCKLREELCRLNALLQSKELALTDLSEINVTLQKDKQILENRLIEIDAFDKKGFKEVKDQLDTQNKQLSQLQEQTMAVDLRVVQLKYDESQKLCADLQHQVQLDEIKIAQLSDTIKELVENLQQMINTNTNKNIQVSQYITRLNAQNQDLQSKLEAYQSFESTHFQKNHQQNTNQSEQSFI